MDSDSFLFFYFIFFRVTYFNVSFSSQVNCRYFSYSSHSIQKDEKTGKRGNDEEASLLYVWIPNPSASLLTFFFFLPATFSVTCNFNTFFELFVISTIFRKSVNSLFKHIQLSVFFFFKILFLAFSCFLNLEYTSNLLSSLSSTVIYFPLDSNSPPTHFFFQKKKIFPFVCF